jgi:hypothetical protein
MNRKIALIAAVLIIAASVTLYAVSTLNFSAASETKDTLTVQTSVNGQVTDQNGAVLSGDYIYTQGANVTLTATANSGYSFKGWIINGKDCSVTGYYFPMYQRGGYGNPDYVYVAGNTVVIPLYASFTVEPVFA